MSALTKSRKSRAATLVPIALVSAAWTASMASAGTTAVAARSEATDLPDGSSVPSQAIKAPASVPIPGQIAPAVPNGTADAVVSGASASGIPSAALSAYQRAAQIIGAADPTCNVPWELIAAIGRVESNHGQYGGNMLSVDGVSKPGVFGPQLNGQNGTQAINDTDGGQLDQDAVYDRAVGPMQFIPSTWSSVKVDADGDGQRNPQDIDDASLASAVYLCSGSDDLSSRAGQEAAVFRYNHSRQYVDLVLRIMEAYSAGDYTAIPSGTYGGTVFSPSYSSTIASQHKKALIRAKKPATTPAAPAGGTETTENDATSNPDPVTGPVKGPVTKPALPGQPTPGPVAEALGGAVDTALEPLDNVLETLAEALNFCQAQFAPVYDPLHLLDAAEQRCAARVLGEEKPDADRSIGTDLSTILAWLGL